MKKVSSPRRLPHILQAIKDLGDAHGSTTRRIMNQLENSQPSNSDKPKNFTMDVRKALKYAVDNGLVKERAGRFCVSSFLGASRKADPNKSIFECRRRRKGKGKKHHRRRRRRHASLTSLSDSELSPSEDEWETERDRSYSRSRSRSPVGPTEGIISHRRRRRGHSKGKRRRRRGRRHSMSRDEETSPSRNERKCLAHQLQDCDNPSCQKEGYDDDEERRGSSYIN